MAEVKVPAEWADLPFFTQRWPEIHDKLSGQWLPGPERLFAALDGLSPEKVRVIIIGQDPYPTPGHANGLAFSVNPGVALPPSLRNIYQEMRDDIGAAPENGDLSFLVLQGVLLLNTSLSVRARASASHSKWGWDELTRQVVTRAKDEGPVAFVLWGKHAQNAVGHLARPELDLVIKSSHPSPYSAANGFFGSRPFSRVNDWLGERCEPLINWSNKA